MPRRPRPRWCARDGCSPSSDARPEEAADRPGRSRAGGRIREALITAEQVPGLPGAGDVEHRKDRGAVRPARSQLRREHERDLAAHGGSDRSEEHTSELQSLMRISYAVLCSTKHNQTITTRHI